LHEVLLDAEKKYDKEWNYVMDRLEKDKDKRTTERIIMVVSSLGALHNDVFGNAKKILRNEGNKNEDKQAATILCKRMVREALEGSRIIWLRKCGFSINFESKRMVRRYNINELERKPIRMDVNLDEIEERNGIFHDELMLNLENVVLTQSKDEYNIN
jgi:hypothetical protein